jgi:glycosyltransferase involved in cell wall biosynthesis/cellulose synthase/poly-beta-1,6-N-acetylglucosamine synthase-like glycosyltransferase/O-antigen/teichoic acid export membrane protein
MKEKQVSVVVPTLNEAGNIRPLVQRLKRTFEDASLVGEVIFIDDHSTDETDLAIEKMQLEYSESLSIRFYLKQGQRGKAQSLIEGFGCAQHETVAMIDADLQYPPEAIPAMVEKLYHGADIIVANRVFYNTGISRSFLSKAFVFFFARLLHNLHCDSQSGLKVFRKKILSEVILDPTPWTFDMEFLLSARNYGYVIDTVDISFADRQAGVSKLNPFFAILEIGWSALKLKWKGRSPFLIHPENRDSKRQTMLGAGVAHNRQRFITHTTLHHKFSALHTFVPWQRNLILGTFLLVVFGFFINPLYTGISIVALLTAVYFIDAIFQLFLVMKSLKTPPEIISSPEELADISEDALPIYSILCPLYREAHMLTTFVEAMQNLDWPKNKLDVLLLLEENDQETITAAMAMSLPEYIRIVIVPHSMPKTKPKACNYGLAHVSGEYVVIYDAEDIPDQLQLKKAYLGFQKAGSDVRCLQAKLNYFNPHQNLLTRLFTAEYSLWFDVILPGLQSINTSIPLGGTSNHFRTQDLLELEGWDPFNVTEDCDLGVRIFKRGYQTAMIDSVTLEEANSNIKNWLRQRSRWIKGYMQTYLVHMRNPLAFFRENGLHSLIFQLVVGGKIAFMFINPLLWVMTISYFLLYALVGQTIEKLYPPIIFYMAATSLVCGNFLYLYYYMIGTVKREHYSVTKYVFLVPFYWILISTAALIALYELIVRPHYWQKTVHGLHHPGIKWVDSILPRKFIQSAVPQLSEKLSFSWVKWLISQEGIFIYALILSNFLNFVFNAFLGRVLSFEQLGLITFVNTLWYLTMIFFGAFSATINHHSAFLLGKAGDTVSRRFFSASLVKGLKITISFSLIWFVFSPIIAHFFQVDSILTLLLFTPVFIFGVMTAASNGFLQGTFRFSKVAVIFIAESGSKLLIAATFVFFGAPTLVYLSIPLSIMTASGIALFLAMNTSSRAVENEEKGISFPKKFFVASVLTNISAMIFLSVDMLLVKHYLDPNLAGKYALLSLIGKMIYFLGSLASVFLLTFVSRNEGLSLSSKKIFTYTYLATFFLVIIGVLSFGVGGAFLAPLLFGTKALAITQFLLFYTIALAIFTLSNVIVTYHLARKEYIFTAASLVSSLLMALGIILHHESLGNIVYVIFFSSAIGWALIEALHLSGERTRFMVRALEDLLEVFTAKFPVTAKKTVPYRRFLIFNWRDMRHKFAGGAEAYIEELARQWVQDGSQVTIFCGNDGQSPRNEKISGVQIIRRGGFYLVYFWAFVYYMLRFRGRYDVIVDCQNGIPFFTPLYAKERVYCLMHHVHQNVFQHSLPRPLAAFAQFLEKGLMPLVYKNVKFITVSESSKQEMEEIGLGKNGIEVVHPGIHLNLLDTGQKTAHPTILYLGRLKAYKSIDVLIRAFQMVIKERPEAKLVIAGSGEEEKHLKRLARDLRLNENQVSFLGKVTEKEKIKLLQSAWVAVNPSFMEGWGIVVIEANACGTPVIASDIPGLRDSVKNADTGYLVEYGDTKAFAEHILTIIRDTKLREAMELGARTWASNFDWRKSSEQFLSAIIR